MPMMAITIISSMSVKPFWIFFIMSLTPEQLLGNEQRRRRRQIRTCNLRASSLG
jgi:hypothetical protein